MDNGCPSVSGGGRRTEEEENDTVEKVDYASMRVVELRNAERAWANNKRPKANSSSAWKQIIKHIIKKKNIF